MPGVWEFPGGKCDRGEDPSSAVVRECLEETGIAVQVVCLLRVIGHVYPHGAVRLHYYLAEPSEPDSEPNLDTGFRWVDAAELGQFEFPEANAPIIKWLASSASTTRRLPEQS